MDRGSSMCGSARRLMKDAEKEKRKRCKVCEKCNWRLAGDLGV